MDSAGAAGSARLFGHAEDAVAGPSRRGVAVPGTVERLHAVPPGDAGRVLAAVVRRPAAGVACARGDGGDARRGVAAARADSVTYFTVHAWNGFSRTPEEIRPTAPTRSACSVPPSRSVPGRGCALPARRKGKFPGRRHGAAVRRRVLSPAQAAAPVDDPAWLRGARCWRSPSRSFSGLRGDRQRLGPWRLELGPITATQPPRHDPSCTPWLALRRVLPVARRAGAAAATSALGFYLAGAVGPGGAPWTGSRWAVSRPVPGLFACSARCRGSAACGCRGGSGCWRRCRRGGVATRSRRCCDERRPPRVLGAGALSIGVLADGWELHMPFGSCHPDHRTRPNCGASWSCTCRRGHQGRLSHLLRRDAGLAFGERLQRLPPQSLRGGSTMS